MRRRTGARLVRIGMVRATVRLGLGSAAHSSWPKVRVRVRTRGSSPTLILVRDKVRVRVRVRG